jgi:hypothetical protein
LRPIFQRPIGQKRPNQSCQQFCRMQQFDTTSFAERRSQHDKMETKLGGEAPRKKLPQRH